MMKDLYIEIIFWYGPQLAEIPKEVKSKMAAKMAAKSKNVLPILWIVICCTDEDQKWT